MVFLASAPLTGFTDDVLNYSTHILGSFLLLGIGLLMAVMLQVRIALKPLKAISSGIAEIREGRATKLSQNNLEDVQPLVDELNNLLDHNTILLKRARNRLADLAHSVKNPLAVISNEARNMDAEHVVFLSQTQKKGKDPLDWHDKRALFQKMFPDATVSSDASAKTPFMALEALGKKYNNVVMVVGSDRVAEFEKLLNVLRILLLKQKLYLLQNRFFHQQQKEH